jgi:DNA-binding XRE family transcriptional regulator
MSGEKQTAGSGTSNIQHSTPNIQSGNSDEMLTKKELAARLKVTIRTIENWQREGFLPYIKISSVVLFHWPEIIEHLKANFKVCRRGVVRPRS